jgi:hypothetical protein
VSEPTASADVARTLGRILELTRAEATHIADSDADALLAVLAERGPLLAALPRELAPECHALALAFEEQRAANEAAARSAAARLRQQLDAMTATRAVVTAYAPTVGRRDARPVTVDRAG